MVKKVFVLWMIAALIAVMLPAAALAEDDFELDIPLELLEGQETDSSSSGNETQDAYWTESGREALWNALNTGNPQPLSAADRQAFLRQYAITMDIWSTAQGETGTFTIGEDGTFYAAYKTVFDGADAALSSTSICRGIISEIYRLSGKVYVLETDNLVWERDDNDQIVQWRMLFQIPGAKAGDDGILTYETRNIAESFGEDASQPVSFCLLTAFDSAPLWYGIPGGSAAPVEGRAEGKEEAYATILQEHSQAIHDYQNLEMKWWEGSNLVQYPCKPVGLVDLNGDGKRELLYIEMDFDIGYGNLFIWSAEGETAKCVYSQEGAVLADNSFTTNLTMYFIRDGSIVMEYETDLGWGVARLTANDDGITAADRMLREDDGLQGKTDPCTRNGQEISVDTYKAVLAEWQNNNTEMICAFPWKERNCFGFGYTFEEAMAALGKGSEQTSGNSVTPDPAPSEEKRVMRTVKANTNVRKAANKSSGKIVTLEKKGTEVIILGETRDDAGQVWYYIQTPKGKKGYIRSDLLEP